MIGEAKLRAGGRVPARSWAGTGWPAGRGRPWPASHTKGKAERGEYLLPPFGQQQSGGFDGYLGGPGVPGTFGGALDVHAVAAGVVELRQLHELEHLLVN